MDQECILEDVAVSKVSLARSAGKSALSSGNWSVNQDEFFLHADEVADFYARDGREVEYSPVQGADPEWVRLFLNGQVLVALLHQRMVVSFHASSFVHNGRGVMILGESGAGKSSLTASFALKGAGFLTDDITPVIFRNAIPVIWSLHDVIRIRQNTASQLKVEASMLREAEAGTGKQYMKVKKAGLRFCPLDTIVKIDVGDAVQGPLFDEPGPAEKFSFLRSEICMSDLLAGMPDTEEAYLKQLVQIVEKTHFIRVVRPVVIAIGELHAAVSEYLDREDNK